MESTNSARYGTSTGHLHSTEEKVLLPILLWSTTTETDGGYTFIKALLSNEEIRTLYQQKWNAFVKDGYPELKAYMEEYATLIEPSAKENGVLWPADYSVDWRLSESSFDFRENFDKLKAWIQQRINYCNEDPNFGLYR